MMVSVSYHLAEPRRAELALVSISLAKNSASIYNPTQVFPRRNFMVLVLVPSSSFRGVRFMRCSFAVLALSCSLIPLCHSEAKALRIAMPFASTTQKVMAADAVIIGKVQSIEADTVNIEQFPMQPKVPHTVANIKIETTLLGNKNITNLKVVMPKPQEAPNGPDDLPVRGGGRPARPLPGGFQQLKLEEGQEGVFFLAKHPTEKGFFTITMGHNPLFNKDPNYEKELAKVKASTVAFSNPIKALQNDKIEERVISAVAIATKYRAYPQNNQTGVFVETPIDSKEAELMMKILLEADWAKTDAAKLADVLGLIPGQYGIPEVYPADDEDMNTARMKSFKAWHAKFGSKFELMKIAAKQPGSK